MAGSLRRPLILAVVCYNLISCTASALSYNKSVRGCCFNGKKHEVGSVVQEISEACLQFLCAVNQNASTSSAVIVPKQIPLKDCKGTPCEDCFSTHCVDEKGLLHPLGSLWMPTKCSRCKCGAGQIINCEPVPVSCPVSPDPSCVAVPAPCCPIWNCSNKCVDSDGKIRELGEEWGTPCIQNLCTSSGIVTRIEDCPPLPLVNASCQINTPEGQCCPQVDCGGCIDDEGKFRKLNEEWGSPCIKNICTSQGIVTRIEDCPAPPFVNASCQLYTPDNECCPQVKCGCIDNEGKFRELNEEWGSPCILNICTSRGIAIRIEDCIPTPFLNDSCHLYTPENQCCPEIICGTNCSAVRCGLVPRPGNHCELYTPPHSCCPLWNCSDGCIDENGKHRELGALWNPTPCNQSVCRKDGVVTIPVKCQLSNAPHLNCELVTPAGKCCPEWKCGPDCRVVRCGLPPKPGDDCALYTPHLSCCPVWNCSVGCTDEKGKYHELGAVWNPTPCNESVCTKTGVVSKTVNCTHSDPPHFNCELITPLGKCCLEWNCGPDCRVVRCGLPPKPANQCELYTPHLSCCPLWNCSGGCVDENGKFREFGVKWNSSQCSESECTKTGIISKTITCKLSDPPHPNCELVTSLGKCCPDWNCGPDCRVVRCGLPPKPANHCDLYTPHLSCCPLWNCSGGCIDENGKYHELGAIWNPTPCNESVCTKDGVVSQRVRCKLLAPPHFNCELVTPLGKCCPEWNCGPDCRVVRCGLPPKPANSCELYTPPLSCCPLWNCSGGCVDDNGKYRELGATWNSTPCDESVCTKDGVLSRTVTCTLSDPPHFNCELVTPLGKCCPEWKCGPDCRLVKCGLPPKPVNQCELYTPHLSCCPVWNCSCVDADGMSHPVGSQWEKNCITYKCKESGIEENYVQCNFSEPEHFNCVPIIPAGECCPKWECGPNCALVLCQGPPHENCTADPLPPLTCCATYTCPHGSRDGCLDRNGNQHPVGSYWEKNCVLYECTESGVVQNPVPCNLNLPEHYNCIPVVRPGECCPKWECGLNCATVLCAGPPQTNCKANPLAPLACCPTYTCPRSSRSTSDEFYPEEADVVLSIPL